MKISRFAACFLACLLLVLNIAPLSSSALDDFHPEAESVLLVNGSTNEVLYSFYETKSVSPGDLTKVATALVVMDAIKSGTLAYDQLMTSTETSRKGLGVNNTSLKIRKDEQLTVLDCLYCMLLGSNNEAATMLAEGCSGNITDFVAAMNARAEALGCTNTQFVNPTGGKNSQQYSCAIDLYRIAKAASEYEMFRTIVSKGQYTIRATEINDEHKVYNDNGLVTGFYFSGYTYKAANGLKYSSADEGKAHLISTATKKSLNLFAVVLNAKNEKENRQVFTESQRLLEYGFDNYSYQTLLTAGEPIAQIPVLWSAETDRVLVCPSEDFVSMLPSDVSKDSVEREFSYTENPVKAPFEAGKELGTLTLSYRGKVLGTVPLVAVSGASLSQKQKTSQQISAVLHSLWFRIAVIVLVIVGIVIFLRRSMQKGRSQRPSRSNKETK